MPSDTNSASGLLATLDQLRQGLLQLNGNNRLLNFKHTRAKSLQFVHSDIDSVFDSLVSGSNRVQLLPLPEPPEGDSDELEDAAKQLDCRQYAQSLGIDPDYDLSCPGPRNQQTPRLQTLLFTEPLASHGRKLEREARLAIEETGANMLHLVFGFLEYPDRPRGDNKWLAPLLCVPVTIERTNGMPFPNFYVASSGEEIASNLSLQQKLIRDFGHPGLPDYDTDEDETATGYLKKVAESVKGMQGWRVRPMMTLTLLSFSNMLLMRELEPSNWPNGTLEGHPLVQKLLSGQGCDSDPDYAPEYPIDDHPLRNIPLIYDADSSQHSALIDVLEGNSRVIEGPPGTGKSQTITNLIACAIAEGKKVLFVAEKLAALEVVKSRLTQAGLGEFVLELHSTKSNRKELLKHLLSRFQLKPAHVTQLDSVLERSERRHAALRAYCDVMNSVLHNEMNLSVHQVLWRSERYRLRLGDHASSIQDLNYGPAYRISESEFEEIKSFLEQLGKNFAQISAYGPQHELWGFFPTELNPEDDLKVQQILATHLAKCEAFVTGLDELQSLIGTKAEGISIPENGAVELLARLATLSPPETEPFPAILLPAFFPESDTAGAASLRLILDLQECITAIGQAEALCGANLVRPDPPPPEVFSKVNELYTSVTELGLGPLDHTALDRLASTLEVESSRLRQGLDLFSNTAELIEMRFAPDMRAAQQLYRLVCLAAQGTKDLLSLRHQHLERDDAVTQIDAFIKKRDGLRETHERLQEIFYLDESWSEDALAAAVSTLREGTAWYRVFQPRWRAAIRLHHRLARDKQKRTAGERQKQLEALVQFTRERAAWRTNPMLKTLAGPHYAEEETPLERLRDTAKWLASFLEAAEEADVSAAKITERRTLNALAAEKPRMQQAASEIKSAFTSLQASLRIAQNPLPVHQKANDLDQLLEMASRTANACRSLAGLLREYCRDGVTAQVGLDAIRASTAAKHQLDLLSSNTAAQSLLGDYFQGRNTQISALLAAHAFGARIKQAGLSKAIESLLLSPDCVTNLATLSRLLQVVKEGWESWRLFCSDMATLGGFSPSHWIPDKGETTTDFASKLLTKARAAYGKLTELLSWSQYVDARNQAFKRGLGPFVDRMEQSVIPPEALPAAFGYRVYAGIAKLVFQSNSTLSQFNGTQHSSYRQQYAKLDKEIVALRGKHIAGECIRRASPPVGQNGTRVRDKSEMRLLLHLFPQQQPQVPVRQIMQRSGRAIQELMPCFMMGPQAVARFLEPGSFRFDLVIMDEASQLPPAQAIGAIARGSQLVVVGDPKQLPPTSFFSGQAAPGDGFAASDTESILDLCINEFRPTRQLRWHYRSQHESLIAFSNRKFYRNQLVVFPSPHEPSQSLGVSYQYVEDGIYQDQRNLVEAKLVVAAAVDHILTRPLDSLGIVTLNIKQRDLIADLLDERLRNHPEALSFREHWESNGLGLFVKNLETVQGDERDSILISTTFGPSPGTRVVRQNFGPISRAGGWRRLNVLFTRARKSIRVFSSMKPEDIVSDANTPEGTRCLRSYLEFARDGVLEQGSPTDRPPESDFEVAVVDMLRKKGYEVTPQLGVAGFRIDIAVMHPRCRSSYLAAIECDGATYHTGASVRDRDRIRQEILESLGWRNRIWRIWSTDWYRDPNSESERLFRFLDDLASQQLPHEVTQARAAPGQPNAPQANVPGNPISFADGDAVGQRELFFDDDDDEDLAIESGDVVTIRRLDSDRSYRIKVTEDVSDFDGGFVACDDDFGDGLLGATVGEHVVVRPAGGNPRTYVVTMIER